MNESRWNTVEQHFGEMLYSSSALELQYPRSGSLLLWTECSCPLEILRLKSKPPGDSTWKWEVTRSWGWSPPDGINALGRKGQRATSLCHVRTQGEIVTYNAGRGLTPAPNRQHLDLGLQPPNCSTFLLFTSLPVFGILLQLLQRIHLPSHWRIKSLSVSL